MSKRLAYSEKIARRSARNRNREMIHQIEKIIQSLPAVEPKDWNYKNGVTMEVIAKYLQHQFQVSLTGAKGLVSLYIASRSDLVVTKGRRGGIHKMPSYGP